jgi:DNA-binding NtrC family response regulator
MKITADKCRILVVDADPIVRRAVRILFARFGYPVASAGNGREAALLSRCAPFDLVVSDTDLPDGDGHRLAFQIKQHDDATRVVLMTGGGPSRVRESADGRPVDGWLFKPFDLAAVNALMNALRLPNAFAAGRPRRQAEAA